MKSTILRTGMPILVCLTLVFSVFVLFRGHNEPGGGFIGGLIAASAFALFSISDGVDAVRRALVVSPVVISGIGVFLAVISGLLSYPAGEPFLTGLWFIPEVDKEFKLIATPVLFDIGVYLVVLGVITALVLELEEEV